jgi:hypothetical protein
MEFCVLDGLGRIRKSHGVKRSLFAVNVDLIRQYGKVVGPHPAAPQKGSPPPWVRTVLKGGESRRGAGAGPSGTILNALLLTTDFARQIGRGSRDAFIELTGVNFGLFHG